MTTTVGLTTRARATCIHGRLTVRVCLSQGALDLTTGYVTPVASVPGEGPVLRNAVSPHKLVDSPVMGEYEHIYQLFVNGGARLRPTAPCFGSRVREDGRVSTYEWQTYQEVRARVDAVAAALARLDLVPKTPDGRRFFGFFLKNCRDWMITALACYKLGVVVVPMYDTLGPDVVAYIQRQTLMSTALCTAAELALLAKTACPFKTVVVTGALPDKVRQAATAAGISFTTFAELEAAGKPHAAEPTGYPEPCKADLAYLCYTSGTTGDPKGAMLSHGNLLAAIGMASYPGLSIFSTDPNSPQEVHISYLPLAHVMETVVMNFCLFCGAAIGFYQARASPPHVPSRARVHPSRGRPLRSPDGLPPPPAVRPAPSARLRS